MNKGNQITISKEQLKLKDVKIYNDVDLIALEGVISNDQSSELYFEITNFGLQNVESILPRKWDGILSLIGKIKRFNVEQPWHLDGQLKIC